MKNYLARVLLSLTCFILLGLTACNEADKPQNPTEPLVESTQAETWDKFVTRHIEARVDAHPQWAVFQGRHEYDGQLPDWSRDGIEREIARLHQARDAAMAYADDQIECRTVVPARIPCIPSGPGPVLDGKGTLSVSQS